MSFFQVNRSHLLKLCVNKENLPESALIGELNIVVSEYSTAADVRDGNGFMSITDADGKTLTHIAAAYRSPAFFEVLLKLDTNLESLRRVDEIGRLPAHVACVFCNYETAKYLFQLFPESISTPTAGPLNRDPLHILLIDICRNDDERQVGEEQFYQLVQFMLKHDQGSISKPDGLCGSLPLHLACKKHNLDMVKLVYNFHPEAILVSNRRRQTPLDAARLNYNSTEVISFLESQLHHNRQAQNQTPDGNGQLPIHRALLEGSVEIGTVKLMVKSNPDSLRFADKWGCTPLHIACQVGNTDAAKLLIGRCKKLLEMKDVNGEIPLHHACRQFKGDLIPSILEHSPAGATVQNNNEKLPLQILLFDAVCDRNSLEYMDAVDSLLRVNPVVSVLMLRD